MATNFVARDGDKLAYTAFIVCAGNRRLLRGLATPWTYFLQLSLSSVILIDSFMGSPVQVLMLSTQAAHGRYRLRAPGIVPCIISFSRQLPCFLMV